MTTGKAWNRIQGTTRPTPTDQLPGLVSPSTINDQLHSSQTPQLHPFCSLSRAKYSACFVAYLSLLLSANLLAALLIPLTAIFKRHARLPGCNQLRLRLGLHPLRLALSPQRLVALRFCIAVLRKPASSAPSSRSAFQGSGCDSTKFYT